MTDTGGKMMTAANKRFQTDAKTHALLCYSLRSNNNTKALRFRRS
ncbi:hypothetical protein DFR31_1002 [Alkalispirillum mobile]|uniref:Uncharacterized protein n=1 Tax=Alkalispirillum mobile TaxID=85925 RepID=A0A498C9R6_9GAMM|nr:hypothetical protein DFR31_1002 [Alkalispirillum mobile]